MVYLSNDACRPTLLAKDRSLTNVVAHEIAHSWTGECMGGCVVAEGAVNA